MGGEGGEGAAPVAQKKKDEKQENGSFWREKHTGLGQKIGQERGFLAPRRLFIGRQEEACWVDRRPSLCSRRGEARSLPRSGAGRSSKCSHTCRSHSLWQFCSYSSACSLAAEKFQEKRTWR